MQDNHESAISFQAIEDKERVSSNGRYQESNDDKNHLELNRRQRDENSEISIVRSVTAV